LLDFAKNIIPPLELKLLATWETISEAQQVVCEVLTLFSANRIGARECAAHHGMALELFSAIW
jgi:hypothetical protein